ncbi:unnamed protein product [Urochloa decumbens]|uniref:Uncharacterized protein n=1 Tax=Urochloa decumbens TaxID=240449 RepID=A0ABC9BUY8_9POAL
MAETAIISVLIKFGELAAREAAVLLRVGDDIVLLRDRLDWLQAFVRDADRRRRLGFDHLTRVWVRQTRDAAFEAEDTLEHYFHKVDLESHRSWKAWYRYFTGCVTQITVRRRLSARIKKIKNRLDQISDNRKEYKIEHIPSGTWTSSFAEFAPWYNFKRKNIVNYLVGFGGYMYLLKNQILAAEDYPHRAFLSILGESGTGKYTLMKEIYDQVNHHFKEDVDIAGKLRRLLDKKRYLLVLGGVPWKTILNCFGASLPDNKNGSRVVLMEPETEEIAMHAVAINEAWDSGSSSWSGIIQLTRLSKEESGKLFHLRVFGDAEESMGTEQEKSYDQDVFDITGGNPLAIVVLAGLLRSKEKPMEWDTVLEQLKKPAAEFQDSHGIRITGVSLSTEQPIVRDMFLQQRPPAGQAKLSNRIPIVRMWTAEGFIRPRKDKTIEEVGLDYLEELASRCLVEVEEVNEQGEIELVRVHNRLLVFLQSEAREASFVEVHDSNDVLAPASVRRLSMQHDCCKDTTSYNKFPKLRSFIYYVNEMAHIGGSGGMKEMDNSGHIRKFPKCGPKLRCMILCGVDRGGGSSTTIENVKSNLDLKFLGSSKFLRVISIQGMCIPELPEEIGYMTHLRYLRVTCSALNNLPYSIGRLLNLQTLDIRKTKIEQVHPDFWKIKTLRHVLAEDLVLPNSMIRGRGLQTLHGVKPSTKEWVVGGCPLDSLTELRSLELQGFVVDKHNDALGSALEKMHFLKQLKLTGDEIPSCVFTAPSLRCLHTLVLRGKVQRNNIPSDIRTLRPNLIHETMIDVCSAAVGDHFRTKRKIEKKVEA